MFHSLLAQRQRTRESPGRVTTETLGVGGFFIALVSLRCDEARFPVIPTRNNGCLKSCSNLPWTRPRRDILSARLSHRDPEICPSVDPSAPDPLARNWRRLIQGSRPRCAPALNEPNRRPGQCQYNQRCFSAKLPCCVVRGQLPIARRIRDR